MGVDDVKSTGNSTHDHSNDHKHEKHIRNQPSPFPNVARGDTESIQSGTGKQELEEDKKETELWFVFPPIEFDHYFVYRIGEQTRQYQTDDRPNKSTGV